MSFGDKVFGYDGWFSHFEIPYSEIIKVEDSSKLGYPRDRVHGPFEYRLATEQKEYWISLLWFNQSAKKQFHIQS